MIRFQDAGLKLRERPSMYIGSDNFVRLWPYYLGFTDALRAAGIQFDGEFSTGFREFVADWLNITASKNWVDLIAFASSSNSNAWQLFWKLFDEYTAPECGGAK